MAKLERPRYCRVCAAERIAGERFTDGVCEMCRVERGKRRRRALTRSGECRTHSFDEIYSKSGELLHYQCGRCGRTMQPEVIGR